MNAIVPSIDILGGKAVRLRQGKMGTEEYFGDPLSLAKRYEEAGFGLLHIVDLDAAFGRGSQLGLLGKIAGECSGIMIQWGGGMRSFEAANDALSAGAYRAIVGSALAEAPSEVRKCTSEFGADRVWASLDFSGEPSRMMIKGWRESAGLRVSEAVALAEACGVGGLVVSSVDADGMEKGPALGLVSEAASLTKKRICISGGIRNPADAREAFAAGAGLAIVGRALYDSRITMEEWKCLGKI